MKSSGRNLRVVGFGACHYCCIAKHTPTHQRPHPHTPVVRGRDASRLDAPPEDVVDKARLPRAVIAENKNERHLGRAHATRVGLLKRTGRLVVERLDEARVELVASIHDLGLNLAVDRGKRPFVVSAAVSPCGGHSCRRAICWNSK